MSENEHNEVLLQLILTHPQARPLIDMLLAREQGLFFTVADIQGHGQPSERLSVHEQVAGAQRKVSVDIEIEANRVDALLKEITERLTTETIYYRVLPILRQGCLHCDQDFASR